VERKKMTIKQLQEKKAKKEMITMLSAYDYPLGQAMDKAGIDIVCVGDSLGMVVLGYEGTVPVTMDQMVHHCKAVTAGCKNALIVADMPFGSYNESKKQAIRNGNRFLKEGGADAVLLEGGERIVDIAQALVKAGIPVMGHLGVTPQTVSMQSGFKVRGTIGEEAYQMLKEAFMLEKAGVFAIELECIPEKVCKEITERVAIPTVSLGGGRYCDGVFMITYDALGLFERFTPKFAKKYAHLLDEINKALSSFVEEAKGKKFPQEENVFNIREEEYKKFLDMIKANVQA
jgi:3-methyl-2-oxobutanoate hydroxymethyltransferase